MRIFNVILNGDDVKEFCKLSKELKLSWIQTYTNQTNMELIMDFIDNPPKNAAGDCGCGCGGKKKIAEVKKVIPKAEEMPIEEPIDMMELNTPEAQEEEQPQFPEEQGLKENNFVSLRKRGIFCI